MTRHAGSIAGRRTGHHQQHGMEVGERAQTSSNGRSEAGGRLASGLSFVITSTELIRFMAGVGYRPSSGLRMRKCPFCAEDVQDAAIVCKHCKRDLPSTATTVHPARPESGHRIAATTDRCPQCGYRFSLGETEHRVKEALAVADSVADAAMSAPNRLEEGLRKWGKTHPKTGPAVGITVLIYFMVCGGAMLLLLLYSHVTGRL